MFLRYNQPMKKPFRIFLLIQWDYEVPPAGLEPATRGLGNRSDLAYCLALGAICSYHCSYGVGIGSL